MSLRSFKDALGERLGADRDKVRPFVCDGSPYECKAFIVGINPASKNIAFWEFWDNEKGFCKKRWYERYLAERGQRVSATRQRINKIVGAAGDVKILETNLFGLPTASAKELHKKDRRTDVLDFLLESFRPNVILLHGAVVRERFGLPLMPCFEEKRIEGRLVKIAAVKHLRYVSYDDATKLGESIASLISGDNASG